MSLQEALKERANELVARAEAMVAMELSLRDEQSILDQHAEARRIALEELNSGV